LPSRDGASDASSVVAIPVRWTETRFKRIGKHVALVLEIAEAAVGNGRMTFAAWWRRVLSRRGRSRRISREASEAGITARVDMVRLEALAEAAHEAMYEARLRGAKGLLRRSTALISLARSRPAQRAGLS
jgi:hypothetical protein